MLWEKYLPLLFFYKRIAIPALIVSLAAGAFASIISAKIFFISTGIAYMLFFPLMHYFAYEVRNPNEYYFYHNLGFSRSFLWIFTVISGIIIGLIFRLV